MQDTHKPGQCLIPLTSTEALWEWHIPSDSLFLSQGACHELGVFAENIPTTMTTFLSHIPEPYLEELRTVRERTLNSAEGSFLESSYLFDTLSVRERMFILGRDEYGHATWTMGHYAVSTGSFSLVPLQDAEQKKTGFWLYAGETKTVAVDACCAELLGCGAKADTLLLDAWLNLLCPGKADIRQLRSIFEQPCSVDSFEEPSLSAASGTSLLLRGAVLQRDTDGKARSVTGLLQIAEYTKTNADQQENSRLLFALNATGDGLWDWDARTDAVYFSPRYLSMLGYTAEQFPGKFEVWENQIHPEDRDKIVLPQKTIVESPRFGNSFECTYRLRRGDGDWAWILGRGYVTHRDEEGRATRLVGMHTDVTSIQNGREELEDRVKNDALTGLRSRSYCDMELERIEKDRVRPVSIIACDICGLKLINDYMGHAEGDLLLNTAARLLRHPLRATDCVARTGGDEFIILLPSCPESYAKKILKQIEHHIETYNTRQSTMPVFVSFGLASTEKQDVPVSKVLVAADRTMMRNKQAARKTIHHRIKAWIERQTQRTVSLKDTRCES